MGQNGTSVWTAPTLVNLRTYIQNSVLVTINTKDLSSGQTDRFTQAMTDVTAKMRVRIESVPGFVVSATANSVPPELMEDACKLILVAIQASYPALGLTKDQLTEFNKAWDVFDEIREGKFAISMPPDPQASDVQQRNAKINVVRSTPRIITADTMRGI